jgi:4-methylaminobutanoate oxidase (formaldehyde-forming)
VLLDQGQLSCGTTWHAAGIVGQLRTQPSLTKLMLYGSELYAGLEAEVGLGSGWNQSGALWVAATADRMMQIRRTIGMARAQGLEAHEISVAEAGARWPLMRTEGLVGAIWPPNDAKANPTDLTHLLRRGGPAGLHAEFFDVTSSSAVLLVMGLRSRALLDGLSTRPGCGSSVPAGMRRARAVVSSAGTIRADTT